MPAKTIFHLTSDCQLQLPTTLHPSLSPWIAQLLGNGKSAPPMPAIPDDDKCKPAAVQSWKGLWSSSLSNSAKGIPTAAWLDLPSSPGESKATTPCLARKIHQSSVPSSSQALKAAWMASSGVTPCGETSVWWRQSARSMHIGLGFWWILHDFAPLGLPLRDSNSWQWIIEHVLLLGLKLLPHVLRATSRCLELTVLRVKV